MTDENENAASDADARTTGQNQTAGEVPEKLKSIASDNSKAADELTAATKKAHD